MRSVIRSHSWMYRQTLSRHARLNSPMPYASMSALPRNPSSFSTSISTGSP
jgi:hypothetical protein